MSGETPRGWQNQEALTCPELKERRKETVRAGAHGRSVCLEGSEVVEGCSHSRDVEPKQGGTGRKRASGTGRTSQPLRAQNVAEKGRRWIWAGGWQRITCRKDITHSKGKRQLLLSTKRYFISFRLTEFSPECISTTPLVLLV